MKAIRLTAYGNPAQNLRMVEVAEPHALFAGEALVRMEYAPFDYSDLLLANGAYFLNPKLPFVIGGEGAVVQGSGTESIETLGVLMFFDKNMFTIESASRWRSGAPMPRWQCSREIGVPRRMS